MLPFNVKLLYSNVLIEGANCLETRLHKFHYSNIEVKDFIMCPSRYISTVLKIINSILPHIQFTLIFSLNKLPFLDGLVTKMRFFLQNPCL